MAPILEGSHGSPASCCGGATCGGRFRRRVGAPASPARRCCGLTRRAKYLLADLSSRDTLIMHLGMWDPSASEARRIACPGISRSHRLRSVLGRRRLQRPAAVRRHEYASVRRSSIGGRLWRLGRNRVGGVRRGRAGRAHARGSRRPIKAALLDQASSPASATSTPARRSTWPAVAARARGGDRDPAAGTTRAGGPTARGRDQSGAPPRHRTADWPTLPRRHVQGVRPRRRALPQSRMSGNHPTHHASGTVDVLLSKMPEVRRQGHWKCGVKCA